MQVNQVDMLAAQLTAQCHPRVLGSLSRCNSPGYGG